VRTLVLSGSYLIWGAGDGNGVVDLNDYTNGRQRLGHHLP
jgi:hypothetical protein